MDMFDRIKTTEFLGREFLTWLWFCSDVQEGLFRDLDDPSGDAVEVWFDDALKLEVRVDKARESTTARGEAPGEMAAARAALRAGQKVTEAKLRIVKGEREYVCTIKADRLSLSGVKCPRSFAPDTEERVVERLLLLEDLERTIDALFERFVRLRLDPAAWGAELSRMRAWVQEFPEAPRLAEVVPLPSAEREDALAVVRATADIASEFEELDTEAREAVLAGVADVRAKGMVPDAEALRVAVRFVRLGSDLRGMERQGEFGRRMAARLRAQIEATFGPMAAPS